MNIEDLVKLNKDLKSVESIYNDINFIKKICKLISNDDKFNIDLLNKKETIENIERVYSDLKKSSRKIYMLKFLKYLELAHVEDEIIELYSELYKKLMLKPDINKDKFKLVLNSDISIPNYIKLFCYFHLKFANILSLKLIDQIMFIKEADTKIYIDLFNNKIERINEKEIINIDNKIISNILEIFLEDYNEDEISELKSDEIKLNNILNKFKCKFLFQRKRQNLSYKQIDSAYRNIILKYNL
jgi:hypothetical protein